MMKKLNVELGERRYPIRIGHGLLTDMAQFTEAQGRHLEIVSDDNTASAHLPTLLSILDLTSVDARIRPAGEVNDIWANVENTR